MIDRSRNRDGLVLGLAALAVLIALDLVLGAPDNFAGAVVVAPVLCAALADLWTVAGMGAVTIPASLGLSWYDHSGLVPTVVRGVVVVIGTLTASWVSHRRRLAAERLGRVARIAELTQRAILDPLPEEVGPARLAGWYISATEEALVGGDFYHACAYQDRARWIIGDVKGKGIDAVRVAAAAIGAFREAGEDSATLGAVAARVDRRVSKLLDEEGFATAILAELAPDGCLRMVNCGHPAPLLLRGGGATALPPPRPATPLGLGPEPCEFEVRLKAGDCVWFLTDGVIEAPGRDGKRGLAPETLAQGTSGGAAEVATILARRLRQAVGPDVGDDSAALIVEYRPARPVRTPTQNGQG